MLRPLLIAYLSLIVTAGVLLGTGLIPEWGRWYAEHQGYRLQTDAFLEGRVTLAESPENVDWDQAWARGGVQQVWGLGVPAWRFPFELGARMVGEPAFPDRFAFGLAMVIVFSAAIALLAAPGRRLDFRGLFAKNPEGIAGALILILFPPFLNLCSYRFWVYEEAVAYGYIAGIGLFLATIGFVRRPGFGSFLFLCLFAGLAPFVRPTLAFYSVASVLIAGTYVLWLRWPWWRLGTGIGVFAFGALLLFGSNVYRFGHGVEFGHRLNLHTVDTMGFASRFEAPYSSEPVIPASRDLAASLFVAGNRFNGYDWFERDFFPGQSTTHRWREFYFRAYDLSYAVMLVVLWVGGLWWLVAGRRRFGREEGVSEEFVESRRRIDLSVMLVWSLIPAIALFVLYLRTPFITSRYLLDFGPAIAVALAGAMFLVAMGLRVFLKSEARSAWVLIAGTVCWLGWQIAVSSGDEDVASATNLISRAELVSLQSRDTAEVHPRHAGNGYQIGDSPEEGWPWLHLTGWDLENGGTTALVKLFVPSVERLTLEVGPADGRDLKREDYELIRAKIGLEFLERIEMSETAEGMKIIFDGPHRRIYNNGMQICFLGFMSAGDLTDGDSQFRLLRVEWEKERKKEKG